MNKQQRKKQFEHLIEEQNKLRENLLKERKQHQQQEKNVEEDMLYIQKEFRTRSQAIQDKIAHYKNKEITFSQLHSGLLQLKQYYVQVSYALKTYDRQVYKESLQKLQNTMLDLKNKLEPKKKFKFSRRDEDFGVQKIQLETQMEVKQEQHANVPGIQNLQGIQQQFRQNNDVIGSYKVVDCSNCKIDILHKTEILFLKRLKNCTIRCAATKSAVFVDSCQDCIFEVSCHQLRIHNTKGTTFGIFVTSKAIIEDCSKVLFKPYSFEYEGRKADEELFQKTDKENLWRQVQDFNWLKENQKSPNYDLIEL